MTPAPLHELLRPTGNRDDAGAVGESLHALTDWFKENRPQVLIPIDCPAKGIKAAVFACRPPVAGRNHGPALRQLIRNARES